MLNGVSERRDGVLLFFAVFIVKNIDFLYKNSKNVLFSIKYLKIYCEKY